MVKSWLHNFNIMDLAIFQFILLLLVSSHYSIYYLIFGYKYFYIVKYYLLLKL